MTAQAGGSSRGVLTLAMPKDTTIFIVGPSVFQHGRSVEMQHLQELGHEGLDVCALSEHLQGSCGALLGARPASIAARAVKSDTETRPECDACPRAGFFARGASYAPRGKPLDLPSAGDAFGIMAPPTGKGAALEEHGGSDTGAVLGGESLHVENETVAAHASYPSAWDSRAMISSWSSLPTLVK